MKHLTRDNRPRKPAAAPTVVVMAKRPESGRVKTRLLTGLSAHQSACVHAAMLECVLDRTLTHMPGRHVLALNGGADLGLDTPDPGLAVHVPEGWERIDQGQGDLGARISHVWTEIGQGPAVFFGVDSPDVPVDALTRIGQALIENDAAVGPVEDGGYWCLCARWYSPALLEGIDWGTPAVYHQTTQAAGQAGLTITDLPRWHDVDLPKDLHALLARLEQADEPALTRLRHRLIQTLKDTPR